MKKVTSKIPAMIGLLFSVLSFAMLAAAFIDLNTKPQATSGVSTSFAWWVYSVITAIFAVISYQIDGIFNVIRAVSGYRRVLHILVVSVAVISLPMVVFIGGGLGINILIWNVYHLILCILEVISIVCLIKDQHKDKVSCCEENKE